MNKKQEGGKNEQDALDKQKILENAKNTFVIFHNNSHWVFKTIPFHRVAYVDFQSIDPFFTAVVSVDDGDGGDDVGLQQVHSPPGVFHFSRV